MTGELFTQIILGLITILGALITAYVVPYLKTKISEAEMAELLDYAEIAVRCAEQIYTPEEWRQKKAYVMECLEEVIDSYLKIDITQDQLSVIVEGIVNEVKHGITVSD